MSRDSHDRAQRVHPVVGGWVFVVVCALLTVALLTDAAVRDSILTALLIAPWPLLATWAAYLMGVASDVRADANGVRVQNLLRRTFAPWSTVDSIRMRWQIEILLTGCGLVRCLGGPSLSRPQRLGAGRQREQSTTADDAVAALRAARQEWRDAGAPAGGDPVRHWDAGAAAVTSILIVWAVVAVIIAHA